MPRGGIARFLHASGSLAACGAAPSPNRPAMRKTVKPDPQQAPGRIPVLPIRSTIVFPMGATALQIGFEPNVGALNAHPERDLVVATVASTEDELPLDPHTLEKVGVAVRVLDRLNLPGGTIQATLQGLRRIRLTQVRLEEAGHYTAVACEVEEAYPPQPEADELVERILTLLGGVAAKVERIPDEVPRVLRMNLADPGRFADLAASLCNLTLPDRDAVLQALDVGERLRVVHRALEETWRRVREIEDDGEAAAAAGDRARDDPSARDRPADIRRRIQALQAALGEADPLEREANDMLRRIERAGLPSRIAVAARREAERLRAPQTTSSEAVEVRAYIEALIALPWTRGSGGPGIDLDAVRRAIDDEHLGLLEAKNRLLEVVAVAELRGDLRGPIPCIVGPSGVGKRTLAMAIAKGLGRPFVRLELGGRSEGQLVGTRRTRGGALMGKIAQSIRDTGVKDPVFLLEELDEVGLGNVDGDPVEALEEALEPENREQFTDRWLDVALDLSDVFFIGSASDFYRIPRDLRDLFIEIRIAGYTPEEKIAIAREWLLPRIVAEHGLQADAVEVSDETLLFLTRGYARDAGVGNLRRSLASVMRYLARQKAEGEAERWTLTPALLEEVLGYPRYSVTPAEVAPEVGVVTGLAWTASGGELMFIEALKMPGTGRLIITGLLGDVMRESVSAAFSYVRSRAAELGIATEAFNDYDIHVHFPVGATPKDGPSAGAAVTLAIASSLADRPVRHDVSLTGEVTLRGKILEIGGVKEKVLAAYRSGLRTVILPAPNRRDLRDVPEDVRSGMSFHFVDRMDQVFELALVERPEARPRELHAEEPGRPPSERDRQAASEGGGGHPPE
ncbi:MAG: ATP-dependent protease La [Gemmatimonadetes bacterium]|nr:ATP-dependent protease La [Gemmatimonadota bacterium]